jgi:uncharacterized membrane protein YtjA (UPF0391 family)
VIIAFIAAIFGFTGILHWTAFIAQLVCVVCLGVGGLSFLFCLFEDCEPDIRPRVRHLTIESQSPH